MPRSGQQRLHIITLHCNRPSFMLLQRASFHHFLRDNDADWTVVFDNADSVVEDALRAQCQSISSAFGHTRCLQLPAAAKEGAVPGDASGTHSQIFSWLWREVVMTDLRGQQQQRTSAAAAAAAAAHLHPTPPPSQSTPHHVKPRTKKTRLTMPNSNLPTPAPQRGILALASPPACNSSCAR